MPTHSRITSYPAWLLRLVGGTSFIALLSIAIYFYKQLHSSPRRYLPKSPPTDKKLQRTSSSLSDASKQQSPTEPASSPPPSPSPSLTSWGTRLLGNVRSVASVGRKKKRITLSLKNTILWNPSSDVNAPNHAFHENAAILLLKLAQAHEVYLIIHIHSDEERHQIQQLLENAGLVSPHHIDKRRILFCSTEQGKIHLIRHIEPNVHIEGGWELDDGEDIVRKVRPFVNKLIWVMTRRRRTSFNQAKLKESDEGVMGHNVELTDQLSDTTLAREAGISFD
ncbi:hypothetical protein BDF14DRAFT_1774926 [Spinellus fusiger]|nr:hypothetical protein BDF14DRAFT_1774926 [Spinellus fusiger]